MKSFWRRVAFLSVVVTAFCWSNVCVRAASTETAGDVLFYLMPLTGGALTVTHHDWEGTWQFGESLALSQGVTYGLQYTLDTRRPNGKHHSMPSGHASMTFTSAEFIRKRYGWKYGAPCYAAATFVAYSRVESQNHWPEDVIVGAGIGIVSSYIFTRPWHGWQAEGKALHGGGGLALTKSW